MLFKIPMLPFVTVMSHLSPRGREYRWGGCAPWRAVNNLRFCFIENRDVVVVLCCRTPLGQGLQTHLSRLHHAEEVKSRFLSNFGFFVYSFISLSIKEGLRAVQWDHAVICPVKGFVYQDALACFHKPHVLFCLFCCNEDCCMLSLRQL